MEGINTMKTLLAAILALGFLSTPTFAQDAPVCRTVEQVTVEVTTVNFPGTVLVHSSENQDHIKELFVVLKVVSQAETGKVSDAFDRPTSAVSMFFGKHPDTKVDYVIFIMFDDHKCADRQIVLTAEAFQKGINEVEKNKKSASN